MADLDSQRLQQQVDELQDKLNGLNKTVNPLAMANAKGATKAEALAGAAGSAADALSAMTKQIYQGQQGAKVFSDAVLAGTKSAGGLEAALGKNSKLVAGIGILGVGLVQLGAMAAEMSDDLFKGFQALTRVGAVGSEGMAGVFDQLQNFRLSLQDIGQLTQLIGENAQDLSLFGGSVTAGAKSLGALRKAITGTNLEQEFMRMGMNTKEINEAMAGYVRIQTLAGRSQNMNTDQLLKGTTEYIKQMDVLTKLTGVTRQQAESQMEANRRNEMYNAYLQKVRREEGDAVADNLERNMAVFSAQFPDTAEGLKEVLGGFVITQKGVEAELGGFRNIAHLLKGDMGTFRDAFNAQSRANTQGKESLAMINAFGGNFGNFFEQSKAAGQSQIDMTKENERAAQALADQIGKPEEGVRAQVALRQAQMDTMANLQSFVNIGVNPATNALVQLANAARGLSVTLPGAKAGGTPGYGRSGTGTMEGSMGSTAAGALGGARTGGAVAPPHPLAKGAGIAIGGIVGGILGYLGYQQFGGEGGEIDPNTVINFGPGTGSRAHFDKLLPDVRERALAMAYHYEKQTGMKLNLASAFRSEAEQADLIRQRASGGRPIAEPGASLHQQGRALDIGKADGTEVGYLRNMGALDIFGFKTLHNDPNHIFMQDGGIASGPKSGYQATLHGTEAVVPLPNGKAIPVEMPEMAGQMGMMGEQISRLDELVALMRNANGISNQILQAATN